MCKDMRMMRGALLFASREVKHVPRDSPGSLNCAGGQLEDGVRQQAGRQAARRYVSSDLSYAPLAIEIDKIDGESHADGMDRLARDDPKARSGREAIAPEQSTLPSGAGIGDFEPGGQFCLPGEIDSAHDGRLRGSTARKKAPKTPKTPQQSAGA